MPKEEWGTKRMCPTTGKRFYDLKRTPIVSPYTGEIVDLETARRKGAASVATPQKAAPALVDDDLETDDLIEAEDDTEADIDEELLEDDEDETVSLDDLADVAGDDDES